MSDIIDLIGRLTTGPERRIGFAQSQEQSTGQLPIIIAIADVTASGKNSIPADGVASVVPTLSSLKKHSDTKVDLPWGIWDSKNTDKVITKICEDNANKPDFIAFSADILSLELMRQTDIAKILRIPLSISTDSLLDMSNVPIDAITVCIEDNTKVSSETIGRLGTIRSIIDKPLLLELPSDIPITLLSLIKDLGVEGLVVDTSDNDFTSITKIRDLINSIPKKEKRSEKKGPNAAIGGALSYSVTADEQDESD